MRSRHPWLSALLLCCPAWLGPAAAQAVSPDGLAFPPQIITVDPVILPDRGRYAPAIRVTFPAAGATLPMVILSHGNRLSRTDYQPLVAALARSGFVVIQPDHPDASIGGFAPVMAQPANSWLVRVEQIRWIARHLRLIADKTPGLSGCVDERRLALIGHSFGGHSVALAMGAKVADQHATEAIEGVGAAILLAPPGHYDGLIPTWKERAPYLRTDWRSMQGPILIINGGKDNTPLSDRGPEWHNASFAGAPEGQDICLMVVADAGHYLGGIDTVLRPPAGDATPERQQSVLRAITDFLAAKLNGSSDGVRHWAEQRRALTCK